MNKTARTLLLALSAPFLLAACASQPSTPTQAVAAGPAQMSPGAEPDTLRYVNPTVDLTRYKRFIIDPVAIYQGPDAQFGDVPLADRQAIADFMQSEFHRTLGARHQIVGAPGPGVLRIHLILAGIRETQPALATVTHLVPVGLAANVVKGGTGGQGSFMGSVTIAADFTDSMTGDLVASVVTVQHPNAMDVGAVVSGLGAARAGVTEGAEKFAEAIQKIQQTGQLPPGR